MKLVVGLGNPGQRYQLTRHNIGFLFVDYLVKQWKAEGPTSKHKGLIWKITHDNKDVLLVQPQTFMNLSGESVAPIFNFYKCQPQDLIVIHDELDIPFGQIRVKVGGGAGGHNGVTSIQQSLGALQTNFIRIRQGIDHPRNLNLPIEPVDYVLQRFSKSEEGTLLNVFEKSEGALKLIFDGKYNEAMNRYHGTEKKGEES